MILVFGCSGGIGLTESAVAIIVVAFVVVVVVTVNADVRLLALVGVVHSLFIEPLLDDDEDEEDDEDAADEEAEDEDDDDDDDDGIGIVNGLVVPLIVDDGDN